MHICLVGVEYPQDTSFGGIATYQYLLSKELVKCGNKVTVICGTEKEDYEYYEDNIHIIRIHTIRNKETVETYYNYRKKIKKIINKININNPIDIIETPEFSAEIIEFLKNRNIPVVVKLHTSYNIWSNMNKTKLPQKLHNEIIKNEDLVIKYADKVICCSNILKSLMPKYHQIDDINKIEVVGNPANNSDFYPLPNAHNSKKILFCGSLEKRKGIFTFIKAIPIIIDHLKDDGIKFQLIGNYSMENSKGENIKQQIYNLLPHKYHKYIEFLGQIENKDLNQYFNEARIGVIPSLFDNLPYVAMEELLTELPIVASNNTGIREMITDNKSGILYNPLDYKELASKVIKLYENEEYAKECGKNGRQEILEKYAPYVIAKQNIAIYNSVIKEFNENKKKMHVCLVNFEYPKETTMGGIAIYQKRIADALTNNNCKVTVVCGTFTNPRRYYEDNIHVIRLIKNFPYKTLNDYYSYRKKLANTINEINEFNHIDVIESPELSAEMITFLKKQTVPVVTKLHTSYTFIKKFNNGSSMFPEKVENAIYKNENYIINKSDKVICCSNILKSLMPKYHQIDDINKIEVVGNPANIFDFYPLPNSHNSKKILFCGKVIERKGVFVFAKAIPIIVDLLKDENIKFQLIGDYNSLEQQGILAKDAFLNMIPHKYHKYIEFLGQIENKDLNQYFNEARIGVIPSLFDNLPYVAMEELLTELPIVASNNTGIREMITDNKSGILYNPLDYKELASKVIKLYENEEYAKECGKNGRQEILEKYAPDVIAKQNIAIYNAAIKEFNEKKEIKDICNKLKFKNIKEMKNGGANYVIKCKYNNKDVIVKFYHKLKNYNYNLIKYILNKDINCNKLIDFYSFKTYKVGIYSYISGKIHRYFSTKQINQIFNECKKINIKIEPNFFIDTIYNKVDFYYKKLKNINNPVIKDIIKKYKEININKFDCDVIIHGDLSYKNILWHKKAYLIDFDEVIKGPFEYEAASFLIKNCFDNSYFDINYAKKIISYYRNHNFNLNKIKEYYYFFIIKVLFEKFYYNQLYSLNLESETQKKDYWKWWYKLLNNNAIVQILFDKKEQNFKFVKEIKNDFKSKIDILKANNNCYIKKCSKNSNLQHAKNEQDILCNLDGYINIIPLLHYYKNNYIIKYYPYIENNAKINDSELIKNVYKLSERMKMLSNYIPCENVTIFDKLNSFYKTIKNNDIKRIIRLMIDDKELHEHLLKEPQIIIHDDLNDTNIIANNTEIYFMDYDNLKKYPQSMQLVSFVTLYYLCNNKSIPWSIVSKYFNIDMIYFNKLVEFRLIKLYNYFENTDLNIEDKKRMDLVYKLIKEYGKIYEGN